MVDLAKIRKKARKKAEPPPAPIQPVPAAEPPPSPQSKLERFLVQAGTRRFEPHLPETKTEEEVELLTFLLGRERYAVDIAPIAQIIASRAPTRVPNAGEGIIGILSLRGSIVTLIDIRSRLHQPSPAPGGDPQVIVIGAEGGLVGFEVDRVLRPAKFARSAIEPQPVATSAEESDLILGVIRGEGSLTIVLDLFKLIG